VRARLAPYALPAAVAAVATWLVTRMTMASFAFTDYDNEAKPAVDLLRAGDLAGFAGHLPAYGGSLVMRAPFALLPEAWGGGDEAALGGAGIENQAVAVQDVGDEEERVVVLALGLQALQIGDELVLVREEVVGRQRLGLADRQGRAAELVVLQIAEDQVARRRGAEIAARAEEFARERGGVEPG
jgi:hypothetical protein